MQRVTVSLDEELTAAFDALIREQSYGSRSEAVRDLVRHAVESRRVAALDGANCVANLSYVSDHHTRHLAERLVEMGHQHHELTISTTHVHLDHDSCFESTFLRGPTETVRAFAASVTAERGVRFGALNLVTVELSDHHTDVTEHTHPGHHHASPHRG